ncbi:succinylglutamate desuccinylase/aspartoacylase family protein [Roseovarius sp. SCSIO 43702]|uniref:succinylglutamate desuccinylase/aspartoacylase domain-containing protein n=1 Tax=Roseovarius sp. SCSIO 43702 TaxID=2823043 RepID=UPI001C72FAC3|nr:succinylglutamate desuccinylase/aspartoacylase family protein [Roseovarius sp. SCSIO 43702]QYX56226.1 succinylglutamate desuccinylase/aspartoacylase family protein [Roseovarius sp. SCSIO 43702]
MSLSFGTVASTLDLDSPGKRAGQFGLTHSGNRYAFSTIRAPLGVIRGGDGPTALVCAGNHGDEYEGQIIVRRLYERLAPEDVAGRLILAPALNMPSIEAAQRVSPLDGGNLNRSFPGAPFSGPTREIAGFVATQLMPLADLAVDLHSGGTGCNYLDAAYLCLTGDAARDGQTRDLARAMGLPFAMVVPPSDTPGDFDSAAHDAGCAMLSCELGGEGKVSLRALEAGWQGVLRVLAGQGLLADGVAERLGAAPGPQTRFLDLGAGAAHVTSDHHALAEPLVRIGQSVEAGQPVALLRDLHRLDAGAHDLTASRGGVVAIQRSGGIVAPGDHLAVICPELDARGLDALLAQAGAA